MAPNQLQSNFLQLPYDIRHQIYTYLVPAAVHISTKCGKVRTTECLPLPTVSHSAGFERSFELPERKEDESFEDWRRAVRQSWADRYDSSWGPHWKCEGAMMAADGKRDDLDVLFQTCEQV